MIMMLAIIAGVVMAWPMDARHRLRGLRQGRPERLFRLRPHDLVLVFLPVLGLITMGSVGLALGLVGAPFIRTWLSTLESAGERRRKAAVVADVPIALDLLATVIDAGRSPEEAFSLVATHLDEPLASELRHIAHRLTWAIEPQAAWRGLADTSMAVAGRAFARSAVSGSSVVPLLTAAADDARQDRDGQRRLAAQKVAVQTAAPLGACFLPAFFLIGILPSLLGVAMSFLR